ncbi:MAG: ATP-binding protein [Deltaproteobacteria bacterium]|jgi:predicted AAA+ superfamily ATPase|nr:ATP-binding protein [Deltaproteobacteria bacterium]
MKRKITTDLLTWKNKSDKLPLMLQGARQVGKTYALLSFGKLNYKNTAYFNFEESNEIQAIFKRNLNPERILRELAAFSGQSILPGDTLVIFDEIQECQEAITSLKYFAEEAPGYHVVTAGSLLGVNIARLPPYSFPVGKVDILQLNPMDFEEFLWAMDQRPLSELIREHYIKNEPLSLHEIAMDWYRKYLAVGGMPRSVSIYKETQDLDYVTETLKTLNNSYVADMAKYASRQETVRIMAVWASVPSQLAKDNRKFQYGMVKHGGRSHEYATSLDWLASAGMITRCQLVSQGIPPLSVYARPDNFKVYMLDTGLLCAKFDVPLNMVLNLPYLNMTFKGPLAENYVCQALTANGITPYYWTSQRKAEVDFVIQDNSGNIIPIEVKSGDNVKSKSLHIFHNTFKSEYMIRVSTKNFGFEGNIKSIPLYSLFCLTNNITATI